MYHRESYPVIQYNGYTIADNTVRIKVNDYVKKHIGYFFDYDLRDYQRPESVAFDFYGTTKLGWLVLVINDIQDPFHDWSMDYRTFRKYLVNKYLGDEIDADEWHHFEDENGTTIPDPITDSLRAKYGISNLDYELFQTHSYVKDGRRIVEPSSEVDRNLYRITFFDYEEEKNNDNRTIKVPRVEFIEQIETELTDLLSL